MQGDDVGYCDVMVSIFYNDKIMLCEIWYIITNYYSSYTLHNYYYFLCRI